MERREKKKTIGNFFFSLLSSSVEKKTSTIIGTNSNEKRKTKKKKKLQKRAKFQSEQFSIEKLVDDRMEKNDLQLEKKKKIKYEMLRVSMCENARAFEFVCGIGFTFSCSVS